MLSAEMRFNESSSKFALTNPIGYDSLGSGNGLVYVQCQIITSTNHDDVAKWKKIHFTGPLWGESTGH